MNKEIKKIKAALRNKAVQVTVFESNTYSKNFPVNQYVLLDDALKAIDEVKTIYTKIDFDNNRGQEITG